VSSNNTYSSLFEAMDTSTCVYMCICVCVGVCMCACVCVCLCVCVIIHGCVCLQVGVPSDHTWKKKMMITMVMIKLVA
jgi:hypothetical protein